MNKMMIFYREVLKESVSKFLNEEMTTHAAALSYYMIFSLPSMLLVILWIAAAFYGEVAVREAIFAEFGALVGEDGAQQVMATLEKLNIQEATWWATTVGLLVFLFFATTVFDAMRTALNHITQMKTKTSLGLGIWLLVRVRIIAFALLVSISFLLVVFLVLDALVTEIDNYLAQWLGEVTTYVLAFDAFVLRLGVTTILFALYFRYLPDLKLKWRDTLFGALLSALLFEVGKYLISLFIGNSEAASLYDAAGSILVLMLWVYYSAAIFLFGATFTFTRSKLLNNERTGEEVYRDHAS